MRKIVLLFVFFQFLFLPCFGQVVINEVMYAPTSEQGGNSYSEWIEIFNPTNKSINLSDWELCRDELLAGYINNTDKNIYLDKGTILLPKQYAIITDGGSSGTKVYQYFNVLNNSLSLHVDASSMCGGLKNTGETINITNGTYTEIVSYNNSAGWSEAKDGNSLQRINSSQNLSNNFTNWISFPPSPGRKNFYENATLELLDILTDEEIYANHTTTISVKIANRGMKKATNVLVNLSINNICNNSKTINVTGINIIEIPFNWTANSTGNFTICAYSENNSVYKNISVLLPLQEIGTLNTYISNITILGIKYTSLFKIEIENKKELEGCSVKDNITVQYNITNSTGEIIKNNNFTVEVGCSKTADTGSWTPNQTGNFTICGKIIKGSILFNNATVCNNITVIDSMKIPCNLSINIFLYNSIPMIFSGQVDYNISINDSNYNNTKHPISIKYWIEEYFSGKSIYTYSHIYSLDDNPYVLKDRKKKIDICGVKVYKIKAQISNPYCNNTNAEDNVAEKLIVVIGNNECEPCPKCSSSKKEEIKGEQSKTLEIEILNLTKTLARNQEFTTTIKLKNNFGKKISFEIYSYIFDGSNCLTGGWFANLKKIKLNKDEEKIINLTNKVENDIKPWYYSFRIRIKLKDGSKIDKTEQIKITNKILENKKEVKETPNLKIWNDTKLRINLSNCQGCKMIIVGPDFSTITGRKYRVFGDFGKYEVFVIKEGIILNQTYFWEGNIEENFTGIADKTENNLTNQHSKITGKFSEVKPDWFENFFNGIKDLFFPLIELMEKSIE